MFRNISFFILLLSISACSTEPLVGDFAMEYIEDIEIPAGIPAIGATFIIVPNIQSNAAAIFAANGVTPDDIAEIKTSFASLQAINPPNQEYDFLRDVELLIETDQLPRLESAFRENIIDVGSTLDLIPSITDLTEYLKSEEFDLVVKLEPKNISPSFITTRLRVQYQVFLK